MIICLTLLSVVLCVSSTSATTLLPRIINGIEAVNTPWFATIIDRYKVNDNYDVNSVCGGSLVADNYVLTARHCIYNSDNKPTFTELFVSIGDGEVFEGQIIAVTETYSYQNDSSLDDIILLKLKDNVDGISPIKVQYDDNLEYGGLQAAIYGRGVTEMNHHSKQLRTANVTLYDQPHCQINLVCFNPKVTNTNICYGDGGCPMVIEINNEQMLLGVGNAFLSNQNKQCIGAYSFYTRVPYYGDWIKEIIS